MTALPKVFLQRTGRLFQALLADEEIGFVFADGYRID